MQQSVRIILCIFMLSPIAKAFDYPMDMELHNCAVKATAAAEVCTLQKIQWAPSPINHGYYQNDSGEKQRVDQTLEALNAEQGRIATGLQASLGANVTCDKVKGADGELAVFNASYAQICKRYMSECDKFCTIRTPDDARFMHFDRYRQACGRLERIRQSALVSAKNSMVHSLSAGLCKVDTAGNVILANDFQRGVGKFVDKHGGTILMGAGAVGGGLLLGSHLNKKNSRVRAPVETAPAAVSRPAAAAQPIVVDRVDRMKRVNGGSADTVGIDPRMGDLNFFKSEGMYDAAESTIKRMIFSGQLNAASQEIKRLQESNNLNAADTGQRLQAELDRKLESMGYPAGDLGLQMLGGN